MHRPSLEDVLEFEPTVLIATLSDALRLTGAARDSSSWRRCGAAGRGHRGTGGSLQVTRRMLEERFGAACLDVYAVTEVGDVAGAARAERRLHLDEHTCNLEFQDPDCEERLPPADRRAGRHHPGDGARR